MSGPGEGLKQLLEVLDTLQVRYFICGSVASSIHGVPRLTNDIDLVADLVHSQIAALAAALKAEFHADEETMLAAVRKGRGFNLIHYASSHKFDIFPLLGDAFQRAQFARRSPQPAPMLGLTIPVSSAEDTLLSKIEWFRAGGEVSDRQWNDIISVVRVQAGKLDLDYLRQWAGYLHVEGLLERALLSQT